MYPLFLVGLEYWGISLSLSMCVCVIVQYTYIPWLDLVCWWQRPLCFIFCHWLEHYLTIFRARTSQFPTATISILHIKSIVNWCISYSFTFPNMKPWTFISGGFESSNPLPCNQMLSNQTSHLRYSSDKASPRLENRLPPPPSWHSFWHNVWKCIWHKYTYIYINTTFYLIFFLGYALTFYLTFYLAYVLTFSSGFLSSICSDTLSAGLSNIFFWHSAWHLCWHSVRHSIWHSLWQVFGSRRAPQHPELAICCSEEEEEEEEEDEEEWHLCENLETLTYLAGGEKNGVQRLHGFKLGFKSLIILFFTCLGYPGLSDIQRLSGDQPWQYHCALSQAMHPMIDKNS